MQRDINMRLIFRVDNLDIREIKIGKYEIKVGKYCAIKHFMLL